MREFDRIARYFAPLAAEFPGALGLRDDAALLTPPAGHELVITKDALSQGIHFIGTEDAALIAGKALRTNLSDLAAMGATPLCYFLALMLPDTIEDAWLARFAEGLRDTQQNFNIALAGGDSIRTLSGVSISITALGCVPTGSALRRSGAQVGDAIYVSGTLGDAALGLHCLQQNKQTNFLINRYLTPEPRLALGTTLRGIASACMDISDGLVQDLGHICAASHCGADVLLNDVPLSAAARHYDLAWEAALSGGDDYELLFTVSPANTHLVPADCTCIGTITAGNNVTVRDAQGNPIPLTRTGFSHF